MDDDDDDDDDDGARASERAGHRGEIVRASERARARTRMRDGRGFAREGTGEGRTRGRDARVRNAREGTRADGGLFSRRRDVARRGGVARAGRGPNVDRTTGYIDSDNTGMGNIFAVEPRQLYTESPTSDKYAKTGIGGVAGALLAVGVLGAVAVATKGLAGFEEANNEFVNYNGPSVTSLEQQFDR